MDDLRKLWPFSDVPSQAISIYEGGEAFLQDFSRVPRTHQLAFAGFWFQAEVLNGGLVQFFSNDTGVLAPEAVAVCREVGLADLATRLEQAMAWFGHPYPRERGDREDALEAYAGTHPASDGPFDDVEDAIAALIYDEGVGLEQAVADRLAALGG